MAAIRTVRIFLSARKQGGLLDRLGTLARYATCRLQKFTGRTCVRAMRDNESLRYVMHPGCSVSEKMFIVGMYDYDGMKSVNALIGADDVLYDIGANVGPFSMLAARNGAQVFSFEGHPETIKRLACNFRLNKIPVSRAIHAAVSAECGDVVFSNAPGSAGNGVVESPLETGLKVKAVSIDEFAKTNPKPTFVKIDTEGHELSVLRGMRETLRSRSIRYLSFEANGLSSEQDLAEIFELLTDRGYVVGNICWDENTFVVKSNLGAKSKTGDFQALSPDLLFFLRNQIRMRFLEDSISF